MDAARAACCGEKLGKGDEMSKLLLTTDVENLTPDGCQKLASGLGIQSEAYQACVQDPATQSKIDADKEEFHAAKGKGLPTIWVNDTPLLGEQTTETLEDAVKAAIDKTAHPS
jgi:2-hydroxychromene-2-carboxylate isomerase